MNTYKRFYKMLPLARHLTQLVGDKKDVRILDVGSGPFPVTGQTLKGVNVELVYCDKNDFSRYWKGAGVDPMFPIEKQDMEQLTYPDKSFDIVNCVNTLDHTGDALKAIHEMERVCKDGGWIYINCCLDQLKTGHRHYWNAQADGTMTNNKETIDLKELGFSIQFIDKGGEDKYNNIIAIKQK